MGGWPERVLEVAVLALREASAFWGSIGRGGMREWILTANLSRC
jgi:hypothetical protein